MLLVCRAMQDTLLPHQGLVCARRVYLENSKQLKTQMYVPVVRWGNTQVKVVQQHAHIVIRELIGLARTLLYALVVPKARLARARARRRRQCAGTAWRARTMSTRASRPALSAATASTARA